MDPIELYRHSSVNETGPAGDRKMTTSQQVDHTIFGGTAAENYERYFVPVIPAPLAANLIETAVPRPGEHVLDVACGTGVLTRLAAQRVSTAGRVVGVDLTRGMLDVARSIPAPPGASIEWREGNAEGLPLPDESFDLVLCHLGLMFVTDRSAAVREMRRVLSCGGRAARPARTAGRSCRATCSPNGRIMWITAGSSTTSLW